ncbi:retrovirus-related pol polyprotein from transposon TNT 1-94 [Tanacetum coccineum]
MFVTACNDSLKSKTLNVNAVCATCEKCMFNSNHDACISKFIHDMNARTKKPKVVHISTRKPKSQANKSVATPPKKTVALESTIQKSKSYYRMLYEKTSKAWKWWIEQQCPSGNINGFSKEETKIKWVPKVSDEVLCLGACKILCEFARPTSVRKEDVHTSISPTIDNASRITNVLKITNTLGSNLSSVPSSSNSVTDYSTHTIHYLVQGNITINRVYYVEGLNHNLLSVGQFCDADLEVVFLRKMSNVVLLEIVQGQQYLLTCKAKRSSFKIKDVPSSKGRLNLLHMDLCGPISKDETPKVLKDFLKMIQRNLQAQAITVRTDRGTKFLNKALHAYFKEEGIENQTSIPRTPEQNGIVERQNRTLVEAARTMLSASKLPLFFWVEAIATACYT